MQYVKVARNGFIPDKGVDVMYLKEDYWDDYSFKTQFFVVAYDKFGKRVDLGNLKIGYVGQSEGMTTEKLEKRFDRLPDTFFSLGQDVDYYKELYNNFSQESLREILGSLRDVAYSKSSYQVAEKERVFKTSLLRSVSAPSIANQYRRVISGGSVLTSYYFLFRKLKTDSYSGVGLEFKVKPNTKPNTNIHALIGRNGVGKTTILNGMVESIGTESMGEEGFFDNDDFWDRSPIGKDYFSSVISVAFSAFDPFDPPVERTDPTEGACYYYVGLKKPSAGDGESELKSVEVIRGELLSGLRSCFGQKSKKSRWIRAISTLESDENFAEIKLRRLVDLHEKDDFKTKSWKLISKMSSGHLVVLLSITKLVEKVEEKSLVLIDEPEGHLHPPLLSAFIRALSELLLDRNGVAIIATHSPVVLQEIPKSCVWKITRSRLALSTSRPDCETFGENVGVLTREVFGLEVVKSGFHNLLLGSVLGGGDYEDILKEYNNQLGHEGRAMLRAMLSEREKQASKQ
jgi:predicted ATPase